MVSGGQFRCPFSIGHLLKISFEIGPPLFEDFFQVRIRNDLFSDRFVYCTYQLEGVIFLRLSAFKYTEGCLNVGYLKATEKIGANPALVVYLIS